MHVYFLCFGGSPGEGPGIPGTLGSGTLGSWIFFWLEGRLATNFLPPPSPCQNSGVQKETLFKMFPFKKAARSAALRCAQQKKSKKKVRNGLQKWNSNRLMGRATRSSQKNSYIFGNFRTICVQIRKRYPLKPRNSKRQGINRNC